MKKLRIKKIGIVYQYPYRCGHTRQHTISLPVRRRPLIALRRLARAAQAEDCLVCELRQHNAERAVSYDKQTG